MPVQLSWARNNLGELQTINLTLRFNSISIVTSAFGRSRRRHRHSHRRWRSLTVSACPYAHRILVQFWQCAQACHLPAQRINDADCGCNPFGHVLAPLMPHPAPCVCNRVMREGRQRYSISSAQKIDSRPKDCDIVTGVGHKGIRCMRSQKG